MRNCAAPVPAYQNENAGIIWFNNADSPPARAASKASFSPLLTQLFVLRFTVAYLLSAECSDISNIDRQAGSDLACQSQRQTLDVRASYVRIIHSCSLGAVRKGPCRQRLNRSVPELGSREIILHMGKIKIWMSMLSPP